MADANVGSIVANLRVDASAWQQGLRQAEQQLAQFAGQITRLTSQLNQFSTAFQQAFQQSQQGLNALPQRTQQASQSFQQFNTQINQTRQLFLTVNQTVQQFNTQLNTTATTVNNTRQAIQQAQGATSAFANILQIAAGIGLATSLQGILTAVMRFGQETIQTGARLEQLRASLGAIAGSAATGQSQFDQLFQTAQRLGVPFENLAQGWRRLTAAATQAGLPLADQRRLLEAVASEGRRVGASNDELNRAFQALGQMASKGVVSMEELRQQLGEALPTAFAAMARGMGRTTEELTKLVEAGGVTFPTAARALTRGLEEIGRQGSQTGDTLQTAFNRFGNELVRSRDELARMSGPLRAATTLATNFLKVLNDSAQAQRLLTETRQEESRIGTGLRAADIARLPEAQRERAKALPGLIAEQEAAQNDPSFLARFGPNRAEHIAQLKAELQTLYESAQALKAKAAAETASTVEVNKAKAAQEQQADTIRDLTKQMDALAKSQGEFRQKAGLAPETFGRPGTAEFLKGQEQALRPGVEKLAQAVAAIPQGVTLPPELLARLKEFDVQVGQIGKSQDALKDKTKALRDAEQERAKAAREAAAQAERALSQEISLTAQLAQVKASMARTEQTAPERAAEQARTRGAADMRTIEQALRQFEENPALQQRASQMRQEFEALKAALPGQIEVAALQAFNASIEKDVLEPLRKLSGQHTETKDAMDLATAKTLEAAAANTIYAQEATKLREALEASIAIEKQVPELRRQAAESAKAFEASRDFQSRLDQAEAQLRAPREERQEIRLRGEAERAGVALTPEHERQFQRMQALRREQERLTMATEIWRDLSQSIGSAWTQALQSVADGTKTVSEAFRAMGQSILQTMADIAAQQATMALFKLGAGLLTGALLGPTVNPMQYSSPIGPGMEGMPGGAFAGFGGGGGGIMFGSAFEGQHGLGPINAPTLVLAGEGHTNPEWLINNAQMQSLMTSAVRSGTTSNGQQSNVIVNNFPSRQAAEEDAARQRSQGFHVIVNAVLDELSTGEASRINRAMRSLQR